MAENKVEIGFDLSGNPNAAFAKLDDAFYGILDAPQTILGGALYYDVTPFVVQYDISRGKSRQLDRFPAGRARVNLDNNNRYFDPLYAQSPYFTQIIPKREVRITSNEEFIPQSINTNLMTNPSFEGWSTTTTTNLITNPSFETDTSGWTIDRDAATPITRITSDSVFGNACAELNAPNGGGKAIDITATPNTTYTFSAYVKGEAGKLWSLEINERTAVASVGSTFVGNFTANGQWQRASVTRTFGATGVVARLAIRNAQGAQHTIRFDGAVLTTGTGTETYFDGSTTGVNDTTFAWTGTANASTSTRACNTLVSARTNLFTNPSIELATTGYAAARTTLALEDTFVWSGNRSLRGTISSALSGQYIDGTQTSIVASTSYTFSCYVYLPATNTADSDFRLQFHPWTGSSYLAAISGTTVTIPRGVWTRLSVTGTMPSNATQVLPRLESRTTLAVGQVYITDGWLLEQSSALGDYFDGNTTASGDFIYRWSGVVGSSSSTQQVRQVTASPTGTNSAAGMSAEWFRTGDRSVVVAPTGASNDSHVRFSFSGLTNGATYTALVTCYLSAPLTGTLNSRTRQISAWNSTYTTNAGSASAPNTAGSHSLRFTFTANDTTMIIALHNGASVNNGLVWFDDLLLVAGDYQAEYFDGNTTNYDTLITYAWTGTENASTSTRTRAAENKGVQFIGYIDDWDISYEPEGNSISSLVASDALTQIANQTLTGGTATAQFTGERLTAVLADPGVQWPADRVVNETGQQFLQADVIPANTDALGYIEKVVNSEPGTFYIAKNGYFVFKDRNSASAGTPVIFADDGTGIPYQGISVIYGSEFLYNQVVVERLNGGTATADNLASQDTYGIQNYTISGLPLDNDTSAADLANYLVTKFGEPEYRIEQIEIDLSELTPAQQTALLDLEIADFVQVKFTPNNVPPAINRYLEIIGISQRVTPTSHRVTFKLGSTAYGFFTLSDLVFGRLSEDNALAY